MGDSDQPFFFDFEDTAERVRFFLHPLWLDSLSFEMSRPRFDAIIPMIRNMIQRIYPYCPAIGLRYDGHSIVLTLVKVL